MPECLQPSDPNPAHAALTMRAARNSNCVAPNSTSFCGLRLQSALRILLQAQRWAQRDEARSLTDLLDPSLRHRDRPAKPKACDDEQRAQPEGSNSNPQALRWDLWDCGGGSLALGRLSRFVEPQLSPKEPNAHPKKSCSQGSGPSLQSESLPQCYLPSYRRQAGTVLQMRRREVGCQWRRQPIVNNPRIGEELGNQER